MKKETVLIITSDIGIPLGLKKGRILISHEFDEVEQEYIVQLKPVLSTESAKEIRLTKNLNCEEIDEDSDYFQILDYFEDLPSYTPVFVESYPS